MQNIQNSHSVYHQVPQAEADAAAWVFYKGKQHPMLYYYKLPALKDHQVTVKIMHTSLCHSDLMTVRQKWGPCKDYPFCPGHEVIGQVGKVGSKVNKVKVGDRVGISPMRSSCGTCQFCMHNEDNLCDKREFVYQSGSLVFGGYGTHIQCDERHAIKVPHDLDVRVSAPLLCAGITVFAPLKRFGKHGIKCAIIGIGGLGHLAVQFASKMGMITTAFTTSFDREHEFKAMGASFLRHSTDIQRLAIQQGQYDLVINTLFVEREEVYKTQQRICKPHGTIVFLGVPDITTPLILDIQYIVKNNIKVVGSLIGSAKDTQDCMDFAVNYGVKPIVQEVKFEQLPKGFEMMEKGKPKFRVTVDVEKWSKQHGFFDKK